MAQQIKSKFIEDLAITAAKLADGAVATAKLADGSVTNAKLADNSVDAVKIQDGTITAAKLASGSVGVDELQPLAVTTAAIADDAITNAKMADNAIGTLELQDSSVTNAKMADNAIGTLELQDGSVTADKLATNSVGVDEIQPLAVTTAAIADDAITNAKMADNSVGTLELQDSSVTNAKMADNSVGTLELQDSSVTADKLATNSVGTDEIQPSAVTGAKIESSVALAGAPTTTTATTGDVSTKIATTAFVQNTIDAVQAGLKPKQAVRAASSINRDIATAVDDGSSIGGVTVSEGDRVLLYGQTTASQNGIYIVGAPDEAAVRADDFDSLTPVDEVNGAWVSVQEGADAGKVFVQWGTVTTFETDAINFTYYNPVVGLIGGPGIDISGTTISADLLATGGLEFHNGDNTGKLKVKLEGANPTLQLGGSGELGAKLDGTGAIITGASGLKVATDDATIEKSANALRVKDGGISGAKIAASAVDLTTKVTGVLPRANGGTGLSVAGASGNVLTSNGTDWVSQAPAPTYTMFKESITLTGTDITNGYVELAHPAQVKSIVAFVGRLAMHETEDYTTSVPVTNTRITFAGSLMTGQPEALVSGDKLFFTYQY